MKKVFIATIALLTTHCAAHKFSLLEDSKLSHRKYVKLIKESTKKEEKYEGPDQLFSLQVTFLNSKVQKAQTEKKRFYFQWDDKKIRHEKSQTNRNLEKKASFFITFFTPNKDFSRLHDRRSGWNILLEHQGQRYEGKIRSYPGNHSYLTTFFPHVEKWGKVYEVTFPISAYKIEKETFSFILTGLYGQSVLTFKPI